MDADKRGFKQDRQDEQDKKETSMFVVLIILSILSILLNYLRLSAFICGFIFFLCGKI